MNHATSFTAIRAAAFLALILLASTAAAQPSLTPVTAPPAPPPSADAVTYRLPIALHFQPRSGLLIAGLEFGMGSMGSQHGALSCQACDSQPTSFTGDVRIGGMLSDRLALMLEVQVDSTQVEAARRDSQGKLWSTRLSQTAVLAAAQYYVTPRLYARGGLGVSDLAFDVSTRRGTASQTIGTGTAAMGALGYELLSARDVSLDVVGRLSVAHYADINETVSAASVSLAFSCYSGVELAPLIFHVVAEALDALL